MTFPFKYLALGALFMTLINCNDKKATDQTEQLNKQVKTETIDLLVGTYTGDTKGGIHKLEFNAADGSLKNVGIVAQTSNPSFLTQNKNKSIIYAVNENNPGDVSSFKWNSNKTELNLIQQVSSEGIHPCFIALNSDENLLATANYSSGSIAVYEVNNGKFSDAIQTRQHQGNGLIKPNQDSPHAHCSKFNSQGNFLYVVDLGIDQIVAYQVSEDGQLGKNQVALKLDAGDGPRHFIFHPKKNLAFIINEYSNSVTSAKVNPKTGMLSRIDKQSTLPTDFTEKSYCADIHISSNGKFLYASNRGHNSIAVFSVSDDGYIKLIQTESVRGDWPRNFTLSPNEKHLLVANQKSNNITVFDIDYETGLLSFSGNEIELLKPVCLKF